MGIYSLPFCSQFSGYFVVPLCSFLLLVLSSFEFWWFSSLLCLDSVLIFFCAFIRSFQLVTVSFTYNILCLILLAGTYYSVSSFCLILYVYVYALGKSATPPNVEGMVYVGDVPWGSKAQSYLAARARHSKGVPYMDYVSPPVTVSHGCCQTLMCESGPQK